MLKTELHEAYAETISQYDWDIYLTQTFRRCRHDGTNAVFAVHKKMEDVFGASRAFVAVEPHKLDGLHLHALYRIPEWQSNLPTRIKKYEKKAFGYTNSIRSMNIPPENFTVAMYCSKYVTKGNDFFFLGSPEAWLLDK